LEGTLIMSETYRAWLAARFEYEHALRRLMDGDQGARADIERLAAVLGSGYTGLAWQHFVQRESEERTR